MSTTHCFSPGTVVADLLSTEKFEALRELIRRAPVFRTLTDLSRFEEAVIERERSQSTGFGHGVAVAHGRVEGVPRVLIALGISRTGIEFDSPDGEAVRLLFVIASPPSLSVEYLQALSTLVRCLRDKEERTMLIDAPNAAEIERRMRASYAAALERFEEPLRRSSG